MKLKHCTGLTIALLLTFVLAAAAYAATNAETAAPSAAGGYPNGGLLVSTWWLQQNLESKDLVVIDARASGYEVSHIPGAVNLARDRLREGNRIRSVGELEGILTSAGLRRDMKFVIYDDPAQSSGTAGWFFWLFEYLGCTDVQVLDGGFPKWLADGGSKQTESVARPPAGKFTAVPNDRVAIQAQQIAAKLNDKGFALVDVRTPEEFNGWQLYGEPRGGHIPSAVNINYLYFYKRDRTVLAYKEIKELLESRGITPDKEVAAYCAGGVRSANVYFILRLMGYPRCASYDGAMREWSRDASLPMEKLARYEKLVYPAWVKDLIDNKNPATYTGKKYVILEVRYMGFTISGLASSKESGFIPGAVSIHPSYIENGKDVSRYYPDYTGPDDAKVLPGARLLSAFADLGITKDTTVVVYGIGRIVPMIETRVAWALMYAGVEDVRVLHGGFAAWSAAGYPIAKAPADPVPAKSFGAEAPLHPEFNATPDYVRSVSGGLNKSAVLVDVRKLEEFEGKTNPYPFFTRKGRIPGAVSQGDWDTLVNTKDDTFRSYTELRDKWARLGITPDREPVFYCGTGWRSTSGFFLAYLMGFQKMRNFDGSFYVWSADPANPIAFGSAK